MFLEISVLVLIVGAFYYYYKNWKAVKDSKFYAQWKDVPKDTVVVHCFSRLAKIVSGSPFVLKLETYLRMAGIKYQVDEVNAFGPKGKSPWISINGEYIADSQLIVEFLRKKFDKDLNRMYSSEQLAIARAIRVMMEERWFWPWNWNHSKEDIIKIMEDDLRAVSKILGTKLFILGNEPCEDDAAIFGQIAQVVWALPNSPYEKLINDELPNLKSYCIRMKEKYWPDWDQCLRKTPLN